VKNNDSIVEDGGITVGTCYKTTGSVRVNAMEHRLDWVATKRGVGHYLGHGVGNGVGNGVGHRLHSILCIYE